jgi:excisionase family DNA binding protein
LTTGQAAKYCSVTPDTILKWIRSGFLPAQRTAGGHHRIDERDLEKVLKPSSKEMAGSVIDFTDRSFRYCWEFNGEGDLKDGCRECAVYQMRAQRCYELMRLVPDADHPKLHCSGGCQDCDYFQIVHEQSINVLIVSDDDSLVKVLQKETDHNFNIEYSDCEYACSAVISEFRPDFAIVDCQIGTELSREICKHLMADPRIPYIRVMMAANEGNFPEACDKEIFARLKRPFSIRDISECIKGVSKTKRIQEEN